MYILLISFAVAYKTLPIYMHIHAENIRSQTPARGESYSEANEMQLQANNCSGQNKNRYSKMLEGWRKLSSNSPTSYRIGIFNYSAIMQRSCSGNSSILQVTPVRYVQGCPRPVYTISTALFTMSGCNYCRVLNLPPQTSQHSQPQGGEHVSNCLSSLWG